MAAACRWRKRLGGVRGVPGAVAGNVSKRRDPGDGALFRHAADHADHRQADHLPI